MKKRILSILLAVVMVFSLLPVTAFAMDRYELESLCGEYSTVDKVGETEESPCTLTLPEGWTGTTPGNDGKWYGGVFANYKSATPAHTHVDANGDFVCDDCGYENRAGAEAAGFKYENESDNTILTGYEGEGTEIVIPGWTTVIGNWVFYENNGITKVTIPASVEKIGEGLNVFSSSPNLESVIFEEGSKLKTIGDYAFGYCESLAEINLEDCKELETIGMCAFEFTKLTSIHIPASVNTIGTTAFQEDYEGCGILESVIFEEGSKLKTIGSCAFQFCRSLDEINLDACKELETIGDSAFNTCESLTEIDLDACQKLVTIDSCAFEDTGLTSIRIPASVKDIGDQALCPSESPTDLYLNWTKADDIVGFDFNGEVGTTTVHIPEGTRSIYIGTCFEPYLPSPVVTLVNATYDGQNTFTYNAYEGGEYSLEPADIDGKEFKEFVLDGDYEGVEITEGTLSIGDEVNADITVTAVYDTLVAVPAGIDPITYDGEEHTPYEGTDAYTVSGDVTGKDVGKYTVTFELKDGYVWTDEEFDGTITWEIASADVAQIGEATYPTLEAAVAAAQDGDEIVLLGNVTLDGDLTINKAITITKGEYKIDGGGIVADDGFELEEIDGGWTITKKLKVTWVQPSGIKDPQVTTDVEGEIFGETLVAPGTKITFTVEPDEYHEYAEEPDDWTLKEDGSITMTVTAESDDIYVEIPAPTEILYAVSWTKPEHATVTAATVDGEEIDSGYDLPPDTEIIFTVTPKEGYEYATAPNGWQLEEDGSITMTVTVEEKDVNVLIPEPSEKSVTVTFVGNFEGSEYSEVIDQTPGEKYVLPETNPSREGYTFAGWFTDATEGTQVTADTDVTVTEAQTLYAHWNSSFAAKIGNEKYATLAAALAAAKDGDKVELLKNVTDEDFIVVETGVTLDLAGHSITGAKLLYVTGDIVDSGTEEGYVSASGYAVDSKITSFAVYDTSVTGYRFFDLSINVGQDAPDKEGNVTYWFRFAKNNDGVERSKAAALMKQGGFRVEACISLEWVDEQGLAASRMLRYTDELWAKYLDLANEGGVFTVEFYGIDALPGTVTATPKFVTYGNSENTVLSTLAGTAWTLK